MSAAAFLADLSDTTGLPQHTTLIGLLVLGLFAIAVAMEKAVSIWHKLKKPIPDHEVYATKLELRELREEVRHEIGGLKSEVTAGFKEQSLQMNQLTRTLTNLTHDMARSIGQLEGQLAARMPVVSAGDDE